MPRNVPYGNDAVTGALAIKLPDRLDPQELNSPEGVVSRARTNAALSFLPKKERKFALSNFRHSFEWESQLPRLRYA